MTNLTDWYERWQLPVREGFYQRGYVSKWFSYWNGEYWEVNQFHLLRNNREKSPNQQIPWRGLTSESNAVV